MTPTAARLTYFAGGAIVGALILYAVKGTVKQMPDAYAVIALKYAGGKCELKERPPHKIFTQARPTDYWPEPGTATWIVVNDCPAPWKVVIDRRFSSGSGTIDPFEPGGSLESQPGRLSEITTKVRQDTPEGDYQYDIRVTNGQTTDASGSVRGEMRICPEWPCSK